MMTEPPFAKDGHLIVPVTQWRHDAAEESKVRYVVDQVRKGKLEARLVVAIERYAIGRNPDYPFPFFERALKHEAARRGIVLPPVRHFNTTKTIPFQRA